MDLGLDGRVVLVTGGAKGIGAAIVHALAAEGAVPVIVDRDAEALIAIAPRIPDAITLMCDLRQPAECRDVVQEAIAQAGRLDAIVNNAGVNDSVGLEHGDPDRFRDSLRTNLYHYYDIVHAALPALKAACDDGWKSAIVNIASKTAITGQGNTSGYAAAKGAILGLTREWAVELLPCGIRVNAIVPAEVMTPLYRSWLDSFPDPAARQAQILERIPLENRMTLPEEIAAMAAFLLSPRAGHITGQHLHVDGGYVHLDRALR
jgi:NAD(P)-dependent dehydrogenase (short-subunit alcohol dehydrogenase family)